MTKMTKSLFGQKFPKLHENERNWTEGACIPHPLGSASDHKVITRNYVKKRL